MASATGSKVDHNWTRQMVQEIDGKGTRLNRQEIDFIAYVIDSNKKEFTADEAKRVRQIYDRRVEQSDGDPDSD